MAAGVGAPEPMTDSRFPGGRFVISLDFELHWGVSDHRTVNQYRENLLGAREVVPRLLGLFHEHGVRATWATVGMLMARTKDELIDAFPSVRPTYANEQHSNYLTVASIGRDESDDPFHFGHSLVARIAEAPGQELATHTFSHFYCLESGPRIEQFRADLEAAIALGRRSCGVEMRSIVFPRNQYGPEHIQVCAELGVRAFRGNVSHWLYRPQAQTAERKSKRVGRLLDAYMPVCRDTVGVLEALPNRTIVDIPASRFLRPFSPRLRSFEPLRARRIFAEMEQAARRGALYHLWWHPHNFGAHLGDNIAFLGGILSHYRQLNRAYGMQSSNMSDVADELLGAA